MNGDRIAVAMSGGVDSSAAAAILKDAGHDVIGFSMQLWDQRRNPSLGTDHPGGRCCSLDDIQDARLVAARLGISYYVVNLQEEFERQVVRAFIDDYCSGRTPSPCVLCNSRMKFDHLLRLAEQVRATHVATGHYARSARSPEHGRYMLLKGRDPDKDQSYFLFELTQEQLARALFPLGDLEKTQVREIARRYGLAVADKAESQEICFVPDGDYAGFIERYCRDSTLTHGGDRPLSGGEIVDAGGRVLGRHDGIHRFTIGQRRGLGIAHSEPLYVIYIEPSTRRVVVGERYKLDAASCRIERIHWVSVAEPRTSIRAAVKIRSRHTEVPAEICPLDKGRAEVLFDTPQPAVTPGQAAVFYQDEVVMGGGWITRQ